MVPGIHVADAAVRACFNGRVRVVAAVLAAGAGRRMGTPKALLRWGDGTLLDRSVALLSRPGIDEVIAVVGHQADAVRAASRPVTTCLNPDPDRGMLSSIHVALDEAEARGADALVVHPVDHPLVSPTTVDAVIAALLAGAHIAVPSVAGRRGHPGGFARASWGALRAIPADRGARGVLQDHPDWITHVDGDPGCVVGLDTPEDYARWAGKG